MAAQLPDEEKIKAADYVIDNSGSLDETERQVKKIYAELKREAERRRTAWGQLPAGDYVGARSDLGLSRTTRARSLRGRLMRVVLAVELRRIDDGRS